MHNRAVLVAAVGSRAPNPLAARLKSSRSGVVPKGWSFDEGTASDMQTGVV
jgi:hypothetical protein